MFALKVQSGQNLGGSLRLTGQVTFPNQCLLGQREASCQTINQKDERQLRKGTQGRSLDSNFLKDKHVQTHRQSVEGGTSEALMPDTEMSYFCKERAARFIPTVSRDCSLIFQPPFLFLFFF